MMQIDQIRPPVSPTPTYKVRRKKRSARDSNREQRPSKGERRDDGRDDGSRHEHIDELV